MADMCKGKIRYKTKVRAYITASRRLSKDRNVVSLRAYFSRNVRALSLNQEGGTVRRDFREEEG